MRRAARNYAVNCIRPMGRSLVTSGLDSQTKNNPKQDCTRTKYFLLLSSAILLEVDAASNPLAWI